jgi:hypothetical protein
MVQISGDPGPQAGVASKIPRSQKIPVVIVDDFPRDLPPQRKRKAVVIDPLMRKIVGIRDRAVRIRGNRPVCFPEIQDAFQFRDVISALCPGGQIPLVNQLMIGRLNGILAAPEA